MATAEAEAAWRYRCAADGPRGRGAAPVEPRAHAIVRAVVAQYERQLIEALPEVNAGVNTSDASGSFTATLQVEKPSKKQNPKPRSTPRPGRS